MNYSQFIVHLGPEITVFLTALAAIGMGCIRKDKRPSNGTTILTLVAAAGLLLAIGLLILHTPEGRILGGMVVMDPMVRIFKIVIISLALGVVGMLRDAPCPEDIEGCSRPENMGLLLFAVLGLLVVVGTEDMLMIFLGLELASIALYIMVSFAQSDVRSAQAGLKYFYIGSVSAAFLLFGMSFVYGASGTTDLAVIGAGLGSGSQNMVLLTGLGFMLVGFGFKVAAVPFHLWAPEVYAGAPPPAAAFIASGSKVAGFFILSKVLLLGFVNAGGSAAWNGFIIGWMPLIAVLAVLSMVIGNLAALAQTEVRRLLAFSGVGHAGYILTGLIAANPTALQAVLFYSVIYAIATLAAFTVVAVVLKGRGRAEIEDFAGLGRSSPLVAGSMALALLSLAGLPPLVGFFGKFHLFTAALSGDLNAESAPPVLWLVVVALLMSAVSLYYYLKILKAMFFSLAEPEAKPIKSDPLQTLICLVLAALLILLGLFPHILLGPIANAVAAMSGM